MSSGSLWHFRVRHILEAMARIERYTAGIAEPEFAADEKTLDAVVRNFQIIGEAARRIPDYVRQAWQTIQKDLPPLVKPLTELLNEPDG